MSHRILVIDDDPDIQLFCRTVLESQGYTVDSAMAEADALEAFARVTPDLIVLDVMMDEVDSGFRLARQIREKSPTVPILMLTSIADASMGVFDTSTVPVSLLIQKPIQPNDLMTKVARLLKK